MLLEKICFAVGLTDRQIDVLELVYQGFNNPEISDILNINTQTVARSLTRIFRATRAQNRHELINWLDLQLDAHIPHQTILPQGLKD